MDVRDIVELVNLIASREISELEVERDGVRVRIVKSPAPMLGARAYEAPAASRPMVSAVEHVIPAGYLPTTAAGAAGGGYAVAGAMSGGIGMGSAPAGTGATAAPGSGAAAGTAAAAEEEGLYVMRSPIVGTFYRSPSPAAEPYVKPTDRVKKGQVLCIVEAMKLMNEIESEVGGTVVDVLVEDGQPVEYGEPLYKIRADR